MEIIHLVPGHVEKPPKVREGFCDRELHKQTENNPHGWQCHWYIEIVSQEDDMFTILIIVTNLLVWVTNITWWTGAYSQPGFPANQDPGPRVSRLKSSRSPLPASVWCDRLAGILSQYCAKIEPVIYYVIYPWKIHSTCQEHMTAKWFSHSHLVRAEHTLSLPRLSATSQRGSGNREKIFRIMIFVGGNWRSE